MRTGGQFAAIRFLLGLAESGFFPGVIVYLTHWFPRAERGKAMAGLVLAVPVSLALGARVSGWLLQQDWLGLDGWQWVFLGEGMPAVALGLALPFVMTDRPAQARWLTPEERTWLEQTLKAERSEVCTAGSVGRLLRSPAVWLLGAGDLSRRTSAATRRQSGCRPSLVKSLLLATGRAADADERAQLARRCLPLRPGGRLGLGPVVGPVRRAEVVTASPGR